MTEFHSGPGRALGRAAAGALTMATALGVGTGAGPALARGLGLDASSTGGRLVAAGIVAVLAVLLVLYVLRRSGLSPVRVGFGGAGASVRALLTGVGVTGGAAVLVFGLGTAAGMLRWTRPDLGTLAWFLVTDTVTALLLEALPEETTLRGYAWSSLRASFGGRTAALGTTALFLLVPGASTIVSAGAAWAVGEGGHPIGLVPEGQQPADYLILLTVFGLTLVAARTALSHAPLWTAIGTHLTFLTVNRLALEGERRGAGWSATGLSPEVPLLVPVHLLLAMAAFLALGWRARRTWRAAQAGSAPVGAESDGPVVPSAPLTRG
ncbi:CPBP family glutamic-type intramembrane protease [Streptomyces axinellae]|uniref:CAAX prenyl protease 2/Lysostaphin resistance protein A-like domain-containing protein n=1 Tax=Streptomyces axinellae TaxID=552788 RepID=A0ABN3PZ45_9ACTN